MGKHKRRLSAIGAPLAVLLLAVVLAACESTTTPTASPTTVTPESSPAGTAPALGAYIDEADAVLSDVRDTLGELPGTVQGISATPDETWTEAGDELQQAAAELGDEASRLADLQPPSGLQPIQDAVVRGLQRVQASLEQTANRLSSRAQSEGLTSQEVQDQIDQLRSQAGDLNEQLQGVLDTARNAL
jgi:hypothetical protein